MLNQSAEHRTQADTGISLGEAATHVARVQAHEVLHHLGREDRVEHVREGLVNVRRAPRATAVHSTGTQPNKPTHLQSNAQPNLSSAQLSTTKALDQMEEEQTQQRNAPRRRGDLLDLVVGQHLVHRDVNGAATRIHHL